MFNDPNKVLAVIKDTDIVLDVGGAPKPLARANYLIDIIPYDNDKADEMELEHRASKGYIGSGEPSFTEKTWFEVDFANHERFPLADKSIDFVFCSHTLEDIGDPLWIIQEMQRVGKRGYIEVPSRVYESAYVGGNWKVYKDYPVGYYHHRWLIENINGVLTFVHKSPLLLLYKLFQIPHDTVEKKDTFVEYWWEDTIRAEEKFAFGAHRVFEDLRDFKIRWYSKFSSQKELDAMRRKMDGAIKNLIRRPFTTRLIDKLKTFI